MAESRPADSQAGATIGKLFKNKIKMLRIPSRIPGGKETPMLDRTKLNNHPWTLTVFARIKQFGVFRAEKYFWQKTSNASARKIFHSPSYGANSYGANIIFQSLSPCVTIGDQIKSAIVPTPVIFSQQPEVSQ